MPSSSPIAYLQGGAEDPIISKTRYKELTLLLHASSRICSGDAELGEAGMQLFLAGKDQKRTAQMISVLPTRPHPEREHVGECEGAIKQHDTSAGPRAPRETVQRRQKGKSHLLLLNIQRICQ